MLGGIYPILIFTLHDVPGASSFNKALSGIPKVGSFLGEAIGGVPIPIYLDPNLTGINVDSETKVLSVSQDIQQSQDPKVETSVFQKPISSNTTINLLAQADSILLTALLAMADQVFGQLVAQSYRITYLNGPVTLFNAFLSNVNVSTGADDDLIRFALTISSLAPKGTLNPLTVSGAQSIIGSPTVPGWAPKP